MTKLKKFFNVKLLAAVLVFALTLTISAIPAFASSPSDSTPSVIQEDPDAVWNEGSDGSSNSNDEISTCSWYSSSGSFKYVLTTPARYFDGTNVGFNLNASNSNPNNKNTTFTVRLIKLGTGYVGETHYLSRTGSSSVNWYNVGAGEYRFEFSKANDGTTQYIDYIEMFSW